MNQNTRQESTQKIWLKKNLDGLKSATVYKIYQKLREKGTLQRKSESGKKSIIVDETTKVILSLLKEDDTYTLAEILMLLIEKILKHLNPLFIDS